MTVYVDAAGATIGGGARFRIELYDYLARSGRRDIKLVGVDQRLEPSWLLRREIARPTRGRRVALNNVSFVTPGGERWTRLGNALHFLTDAEAARLEPSLRTAMRRQASLVHLAARRSDVLVTPSTAMAERVRRKLPSLASRIIPRLNPVSASYIPKQPRDHAILCPVLFAPYKKMAQRLTELLGAIGECGDSTVRVRVTAESAEVTTELASHPQVDLVGDWTSTTFGSSGRAAEPSSFLPGSSRSVIHSPKRGSAASPSLRVALSRIARLPVMHCAVSPRAMQIPCEILCGWL